MSRVEADRDDLFAELATARFRWEFVISGSSTTIVAGVRSGERFSIYLTPDRCYHFDAESRLKRAFVEGRLYRTQGETLASLTRLRTPEETQFQRVDLTPDGLTDFLNEMTSPLRSLFLQLERGEIKMLRAEGTLDPVTELKQQLERILHTPVRLAPAFPTRRK